MVTRSARTWTITRILASLLGAYFVYSTIYELIMVASTIMGGAPLEVMAVYASGSAIFGILSVISILFIIRGHLPTGKRQAGRGCLFLIVASFASMVIAALVIAILKLEPGPEAALRITIIYSGGALGGVLGLYLARPSATTLLSRGSNGEDHGELVGSADQAINSLQSKPAPSPKPAWRGTVIDAALTAFIASIFGCLLTYFSFTLSPCVPPEAGTDSGAVIAFGTISMVMWSVSTPLAMLLGGLLGYGTFRYLKLREIKSHNRFPAFIAGGFSGLVFTIITMVLFQKLLCSG